MRNQQTTKALDAARAIKAADTGHIFALYAVSSNTYPGFPPPSDEETCIFEFVKVPKDGPGGFIRTGVLFYDQDQDMAVNLANCVNEECGLDIDDAERIVAENMARA